MVELVETVRVQKVMVQLGQQTWAVVEEELLEYLPVKQVVQAVRVLLL